MIYNMNSHFKYHAIYLIIIAILLILGIFSLFNRTNQKTKPSLATVINEQFITVRTNKTFMDATEDAAFAISERNFRITNTLRIGHAVRERGRDEFPENDVILFCNIHYAELMLDLESDYVNHCPGRITIREAPDDEVIISAPLVPLHENNQELNSFINEVNQFVIERVVFDAENW